MHWTRVSLFCLGAALLASSQSAFAQVVSEQTGVVQLEDYSGSMSLSNDGGSWMQVDRMSGDGVGFQSGYTRVGVRTKWLDFGESHVFSELNGTMNDQGRLGTNLGLGYRTLYDGGVFGLHGWYDNYESNYGHNYQQTVVGAEYLHEWMDLRVNGYMPFGDRDNFIGVLDPGTELAFQGNDFGTIGTGQIERSLAGFDAEAGVPLPVATFLKAFLGTYYLRDNDDEDTWGVRSRLEARIGHSATLNFMVTDDDNFGTNLNFGATIWYGGGPTSPFKFSRDRSGPSRLYDPVRRNQPVQLVQDRDIDVFVPLVNTDTGNEFNITWVDNDEVAPGDGTFENPFTELPNAAPGSDYILVRRGDGGPTEGNIILEDDQHLFGEGRVYTLNTDRLGPVEIPDQFFDQQGTRPILVPQPGFENVPIVTLASNNEVINFSMTGGTAAAILGNFVEDFRIEDIDISSEVGIFINDASGTGILNNIDVTNIAPLQTGINIRNQGGDVLNLGMTDITAVGGATGVQVQALGATVNLELDGLTTDSSDSVALILRQTNGLLNADLLDVDILNTGGSTGDGILVESNGGETNIDMGRVDVRGQGDLLNVIGSNTTDIVLNAVDVDFSNSGAGSGVVIDVDDTVGTFNFINMLASNNAVDGFRLNATNGSTIDANIIDSNVSGNGDNNFEVNSSGGSVVNFFVDPTIATDSGNDAFLFSAIGAGTELNSTFIDVDLARAGGSAISGVVDDLGLSRLFLTRVQASDSGLHGLTVSTTDTSDFLAVITDSSFTRSNDRGVDLFVSNNSNVLVSLDGTPANNNGAEGLHYEVLSGAQGGSSLIGFVTDGNFSDNPINNVSGFVNGVGSFADWTFTNTTADNLASGGSVELTSLGGGRQDFVWTGALSSISQGDADGVNLTATGPGSIVTFGFNDGRINDNGGQGIEALASGGGQIQVDLEDAEVTLNMNENVLATALTGGQAVVNALNSNLSDGGVATTLDNVLLTADGAGSVVGGVFDGVTLDRSGLNGLHAFITNDGSLDLEFRSSDALNPGSASNNANGSGIRIEAVGATSINVASSGDSVISDNLNDNVDIDVAGADFAFVQMAGLMDRSVSGDGINVNFDAVLSGGIDIGPGSASDNFDDGVEILVNNSNLDQGISITGMTLTGNGGEPIVVDTLNSDINGGAISGNVVDGGTNGITWTSNGGTVDVTIVDNDVTGAVNDGINVRLLSGTTLDTMVIANNIVDGSGNDGVDVGLDGVLGAGTILFQTNQTTNNGNNGLGLTAVDSELDLIALLDNVSSTNIGNGILVDISSPGGTGTLQTLVGSGNTVTDNLSAGMRVLLAGLDTSVILPDVSIDTTTATGNGAEGVSLSATDMDLGTLAVDQSNMSDNTGGDGLLISLTNNATTLVSISGSAANGNSGNGFNVETDNSDIATLNIVDNVGGTGASVGLTFLVDGSTLSVDPLAPAWTIANSSDPGILLSSFDFDITPLVYNTDSLGGTFAALPFTPELGSDVTTGLTTVNGNAVPPYPITTVANFTSLLNMTFSDFQSGESFSWNIDVDTDTVNDLQVFGNNLIGAPITVTFDNGLFLTGSMQAVLGNPDASVFVATGGNITSLGATNNGLDGIRLSLDNGSSVGAMTIDNNVLNSNGTNGIEILVAGASTLPTAGNAVISNNTITGHANGDGIRLVNPDTGGAAFGLDIANNVITGNTGGNGVNIALDGTAGLMTANIVNNTQISGNGDNGVSITTTNTGTALVSNFSGNGLTNNGLNGVQFNADGPSTITVANFENNTVTNNVLNGVHGNVTAGGTLQMTNVLTNEISANGANGVLLTLVDGNAVVSDFSGNNLDTNAGMGVRIDSSGASNFEFHAGLTAANTFDGHTGASIGARLLDDSVGVLEVTNSLIENTVAGGDPLFLGDGIVAILEDRSILDGSVQSSTIRNNAGSGIRVTAAGNNNLEFTEVQSFNIGGATADLGNLIENNGIHGIDFLRLATGRIGTVTPVTIQNNVIQNNTVDGIHLSSRNDFAFIDQYVIDTNLIQENGNDGIQLDVQADAGMFVGMFSNDIINNNGDGILVTEAVNFPTDLRNVQGEWQENLITGNAGNGINIAGHTENLLIGSTTDPTLGNVIATNGEDGINISGAATLVIGSNLIASNDFHGVEIFGATFKDVTLVANHITDNGFGANAAGEIGDGVEFNNNNGAQFLTMLGNQIDFNAGRGIDILNQNDAFSLIDIGVDLNTGLGNVINQNGGEGIYIVNTASATQDQFTSATVDTPSDGEANSTDQPVTAGGHKGMNRDGAINDSAFLNITIDGAVVTNNGHPGGFQASGIVTRVGTTGGDYGFTNPGGFASDIGFGGVVMQLTNTETNGSFGDDLFFESFTSTVDPIVTAGTWTQAEFDVDDYSGDALARLDLTYGNNVVGTALATTQGAYYNNAEGVFKSRLNNIVAPNLAGPFANAARRRNAQRQGLRTYGDGTVLPPTVPSVIGGPASLQFLFAGMGDSTFRLNTSSVDSDSAASLQADGFIIDDTSPLQGQFDADGVFYPIGGNTQDFRSPWGWGTF